MYVYCCTSLNLSIVHSNSLERGKDGVGARDGYSATGLGLKEFVNNWFLENNLKAYPDVLDNKVINDKRVSRCAHSETDVRKINAESNGFGPFCAAIG